MQENPYAKYAQPQGVPPAYQPAETPAMRPIFTAPKSAEKLAEEQRKAAAEARAQRSESRAETQLGLSVAAAERAAAAAEKSAQMRKNIPEAAATKLETNIGVFGALKGAASTFKDDYAGNTLTGDLENYAQAALGDSESSPFGVGTPGQRDWWANFRTMDNQIRNELFGATLTPSEQRSYESTTISPSMDPKIIRENLNRRVEIVQKALQRRRAFYEAGGYNVEQIDALMGELAGEITGQGERQNTVETIQEGAAPTAPFELPPEKERAILDFVKGNQGNPGFTLEAYNTFLQSQGLPPVTGDAGEEFVKAVRGGTAGTEAVQVFDPELERLKEERGDSVAYDIDAAIRGFADTATLGSADRIAAASDTLFGGGTYDENLLQQRRISQADTEVNPIARIGGQVAGGFALPGAGVQSVRGLAGLGAAYGGAYGFQSDYGDIGSRLASAVSGAAAGGALGGLIGQGAKVYRARRGVGGAYNGPDGPGGGGPSDATPQEVFDASQRIGVDLMPADVGGTMTGMATSAARVLPFSAPSIVSGARRVRDQAMAARDAVASSIGNPMETLEQAGEMATRGALKFRSQSRDAIGRKYTKAREMAGAVQISPQKAVETLDQNIAALSEVPGGAPGLSYLQTLRDDIASRGGLTIDGIRGMRTQIRERFRADGLAASDAERRAMQVADAAAEDIAASLAAQGKSDAAALFRQADKEWKARAEMLDEVIMPIIGRQGQKSGEEVMKALQTAAQGNNRRFSQFIQALPKAERNDVSATLISNLGRSGPGAQNAAGDAFSLPVFLTHWNQLGRTAKNAVLQGEARRNMDDLARVAEGAKASGRFTNFSNTGIAVGGPATAASLLADVFTFGKIAGSQYAAGRLLSSPAVTKALVRVSRAKSAAARSRAVESLSDVAAKDAGIAADVLGLQARLREAYSQSPGRLAAEEENQ